MLILLHVEDDMLLFLQEKDNVELPVQVKDNILMLLQEKLEELSCKRRMKCCASSARYGRSVASTVRERWIAASSVG